MRNISKESVHVIILLLLCIFQCIIVDIVCTFSILISSYPPLKKRKDLQQSYWPMIGKYATMHVHIHVHVHVYVHVHVCIFTCTCTCTPVYAYVHVDVHLLYCYYINYYFIFRIDKLFQTVQSVAQAPSLAKVGYAYNVIHVQYM